MLPQVVGSLIYEIRMRRDITAVVHSFMQRFPEVATLALAPVRAGARTSEAIVTIKSCRGLQLRAHGEQPAPYVHFDFFDFGEQETHAREGRNPVYDQTFRFPVDAEGDFREVTAVAVVTIVTVDAEGDFHEVLKHRHCCDRC